MTSHNNKLNDLPLRTLLRMLRAIEVTAPDSDGARLLRRAVTRARSPTGPNSLKSAAIGPESGLGKSDSETESFRRVDANYAVPLFNFPRALGLFGFILPKRTREQVFEPEYDDVVAMWIRAQRAEYCTIPARLCLNLVFAVRATLLAASCFRLAVWATGLAGALRFGPPLLKHLGQWLFSR